ncbi:DUF2384 domain-containing protein [Sphingomonas naphthae]|uniref:DUF2384 domain-containing protein n=1 Tax=Sphingomonas naphthae TaxID=1813468 RepID=A0ABY7THJ4_9SPHN|nr:antitoxin Xre/MbcA/ParS toxin-binding domain-containing protein [Sphingomonas naphthae]WCT72619.1 DUF2384 domain-containing protein [Sphingomonas naphthae]
MSAPPPGVATLDIEVVLDLWRTVAVDWELDPSEALALLGWRDRGGALFDHRDVRQAAYRLELIIEFAPVAADLLGSERAVRIWLRRPSEALSGATPIQHMSVAPDWIRFLIDNQVPLA